MRIGTSCSALPVVTGPRPLPVLALQLLIEVPSQRMLEVCERLISGVVVPPEFKLTEQLAIEVHLDILWPAGELFVGCSQE